MKTQTIQNFSDKEIVFAYNWAVSSIENKLVRQLEKEMKNRAGSVEEYCRLRRMELEN